MESEPGVMSVILTAGACRNNGDHLTSGSGRPHKGPGVIPTANWSYPDLGLSLVPTWGWSDPVVALA